MSPLNFSLGPTVYMTLDGTEITGTVSVPAFSSKILVQADSIVSINTTEKSRLVQFKMKSAGIHYTLLKRGAVSLALYSLAHDVRSIVITALCRSLAPIPLTMRIQPLPAGILPQGFITICSLSLQRAQ